MAGRLHVVLSRICCGFEDVHAWFLGPWCAADPLTGGSLDDGQARKLSSPDAHERLTYWPDWLLVLGGRVRAAELVDVGLFSFSFIGRKAPLPDTCLVSSA